MIRLAVICAILDNSNAPGAPLTTAEIATLLSSWSAM